MSRPAWPVVRAALLAAVIAVHGLAAAPVPQVVTAAELKNPVSADEVARWSERLGALGWAMTPAELGERVIAVTRVIGGAHQAALAPFQPLFRWTGTGQGWALFANPDTHPGRLVIRVHDPQGWRLLYQGNDPEHAWAVDRLSYRRVRGLYDDNAFRARATPPYQRFSRWISARILASDPRIDQVEVSTARTHTTLPGRPPDLRVDVQHVITTPRPR